MSTTAIVGLDVGTSSVVIGLVRRGGVDIILNEASKRLTP
jgi:molecular chaperone DnaK (HSP70)